MRIALLIAAAMFAAIQPAGAAEPWRSSLYPEDWFPGFTDASGRFLQDFSYAGYHRGERPLPDEDSVRGPVVDVTAPPYQADASGGSDTTQAIREAIQDVSKEGGGVVYLPEGIYLVEPQTEDESAALYLDTPGVVLRGDGPDKTFIYNSETEMRHRSVIRVAPRAYRDTDFNWRRNVGEPSFPLAEDAFEMTTTIVVENSDLQVGDWVVVMADATDAWIAEHGMTGTWTRQSVGGVTFYRRIMAKSGNRFTLDIPLRYPVLLRDDARVARTVPHIDEVGIEDLAIGMRPQLYGSLADDAWNLPGTGGWKAHDSSLIELNHVVNGWIRNVSSFRPLVYFDFHFLSNGIRLAFARSITVANVELQRSQYHGEGGNGYHFTIQGSDNLFTNCRSLRARHNFTFSLIATTGNVLHQCTALDGRLPVDFHMHLSPANLIDGMVLDDDTIEAVRRNHADHGHGTTQSVFWNTRGETEGWEVDAGIKKLIRTAQYGWGYAIGTSGPDRRIETPDHQLAYPTDFVEGQGQGSDLVPSSLYESQLERRLSLLPPARSGGSSRRVTP